jgi:hypothetical protein
VNTDDDARPPAGEVLLALAEGIAADNFDAEASRRRMIASAAAFVPGCTWASVTQEVRGQAITTAADSDIALAVDNLQYDVSDGPCLHALRWKRPVEVELETDKRWPSFATRAVTETPVRVVVSRPLIMSGLPSGSVNFYGASTELLTAQDAAQTAAGFVGLAAVAMAQRERVEHLRAAMKSRETISAAVGILMARSRLTYDQAFQRLVAESQQSHRKLRDVAEDVMFTGALTQQRPDAPPSPRR